MRKTRATGADAETQILEVDLSEATPYPAQLNNAVIAVDTFTVSGGKPQQLDVTIYFNGDPSDGTVAIADGEPTFTATP